MATKKKWKAGDWVVVDTGYGHLQNVEIIDLKPPFSPDPNFIMVKSFGPRMKEFCIYEEDIVEKYDAGPHPTVRDAFENLELATKPYGIELRNSTWDNDAAPSVRALVNGKPVAQIFSPWFGWDYAPGEIEVYTVNSLDDDGDVTDDWAEATNDPDVVADIIASMFKPKLKRKNPKKKKKRKNPSADVHIHRAEEQLARAKETKEPVRRAQRIGAAMQEAYWVMSDEGPHREHAARIHREALKLRDAMTKKGR